MRLQYLIKNITGIDEIKALFNNLPKFKEKGKEKNILVSHKNIDESDYVNIEITIEGKSKEVAKYLLKVDSLIQQLKPVVIINEASAYFNRELYNLVNAFERKLRTMLYLKVVGKVQEEIGSLLEELTFEKIYELLFSDENFISEMRKIVNNKEHKSSKAYYLKQIDLLKENTKWDAIVNNNNLNIIKENFLELIDYRNDVMHAHNISYDTFYKAKKLFTLCIVDLEKEIVKLIESKEYREQSDTTILELLNSLSDDIPDEIVDTLYNLTRW